MESKTEGRLETLEITVEGIKAETAAIRRDMQQMMRLMGGGANSQDGRSAGRSNSVNDNQERRDQGSFQQNWRKRVDLPAFEGTEPHSWINRVEWFFDIQKVAEEDKVELAYISMEGSASYWFKVWKDKATDRSWTGLKLALLNRFGGGFRGTVFEQMATLRQEGTVEEYVRNFEILLGQTQGLAEELVLGFFLAGLREDVKGHVRIQDPQEFMVAVRIARDVEDAMFKAQGGGRGNKSSGDNFHAAPNIDHSQEFVRKDLKEWLLWLRREIGYDGWRLDFVRGFWGGYVKDYLEASEPYFAVGEYWDSLSYTYGEMDHNQDAHRQRIVDWINATGGTAGAFDVTTKGILHSALERCEYWRLSDQKGKPPGVLGWWPSRAVTFIENHDTGSTQGHWRFPSGKEMQGYAYTLTHPGTPSVFYDHLFSQYKTEISTLLSIRKRNKIHCRSTVKICKAERDVYAALIDEKVAMKIGPGQFEPPSGSQKWSSALEGRDYKIWEAS
ncbi:alpha-amylase 3, chloroplastic-like [Vigna umbellata]|uniref:alpha-amylase 3, chloroplastic-like n=1 Tax=Vigna umbellata TaxID=87088 RepID=UPI001F5EC718|nr:alpha-amylase 3, chloroplastic-like [Vigna umbellata]